MSDKSDNYLPEGKRDLKEGAQGTFQGQINFPLQEKVEKICHVVFYLLGKKGEERGATENVLEENALHSLAAAAYFCVTKDGKKDLLSGLLEMISLVRLAVTQGVIEEKSAQVLAGEIHKTIERIARMGSLPSVSLDDLRSADDERPVLEAPLSSSLKELFSPQGSDTPPASLQKDISRTYLPKKKPTHVKEKTAPLSDREGQVLSIVKQKGTVSIKDISEVVKGCSEKTLQRTLIALVEQGSLKKEGERRWSTYRLA